MEISTLELGLCKVLLQFRINPNELPLNIQVRKAGPFVSEGEKTLPILERDHVAVDLKTLLALGYSVESVYAVKRIVKGTYRKPRALAFVSLWLKRESPAAGFRHWESVQDFLTLLAGMTWNFVRVYRNENEGKTPSMSINCIGKLENHPPLASLSFRDIESPTAAPAPRLAHAAVSV